MKWIRRLLGICVHDWDEIGRYYFDEVTFGTGKRAIPMCVITYVCKDCKKVKQNSIHWITE